MLNLLIKRKLFTEMGGGTNTVDAFARTKEKPGMSYIVCLQMKSNGLQC
jgi:hypothetical protein